jgi:hypothetical protein
MPPPNLYLREANSCLPSSVNNYFHRWVFQTMAEWWDTQSRLLQSETGHRARDAYASELAARVRVGRHRYRRVLLFSTQRNNRSPQTVLANWRQIFGQYRRAIVEYQTRRLYEWHTEAISIPRGQDVRLLGTGSGILPYTGGISFMEYLHSCLYGRLRNAMYIYAYVRY